MEFQIDAPDEIKPKIMQKITQNGILKSIKRKVKIGMMIAVEELKNNPELESNLERKIFKNADPYELKALQSIFNFLSTNKMNYTLSTLLEESAVRRSSADTTNIIDLIDAEINHPENPINNYVTDEDTRYYDETAKITTKSKQNSSFHSLKDKNSSANYINNTNSKANGNDGYFNNFNSNLNNDLIKNTNESTFNNNFGMNTHLIDNYTSNTTNNYFNFSSNSNFDNKYNYSRNNQSITSRNNSEINQESQGFSISRRTFERNQFVISVVNL